MTMEDLVTDFDNCLEVWHEHGCFVVDDLVEPELLYAVPIYVYHRSRSPTAF